MRKLVIALAVLMSVAAPLALAGGSFPEKIALPNAFAPEGIEIAHGNTFWVGSRETGAIVVGNLRTGAVQQLVAGATTPNTRGATGIEYDRGRLWVAGAGLGTARIYNARTGALLREYQLATPPGTFINDVVVTRRAAYFTDSQRPVLYRIEVARDGAPGALTTIPLGPDYQHVTGEFNLNGIVATPFGGRLIAVQSFSRKLLVINPSNGRTRTIDIGGYDLVNGDGLLLLGEDAVRRPEQVEQGRRLPAVARPDEGPLRPGAQGSGLRRPHHDRPCRPAALRRERALRHDDAAGSELPRGQGRMS